MAYACVCRGITEKEARGMSWKEFAEGAVCGVCCEQGDFIDEDN